MKIGIDIDGVLINSEQQFRFAAEIFDATVLKRNSLIDEKEPRVQQRYNWSEEEMNEYFKTLYENAKKSSLMPGAIETVNKLQEQGNELIIITARGNYDIRLKNEAEEKLSKAGLKFSKYYWKVEDKVEVCKKENIDYMIDDYYKICEQTSKNGIKTLYLRENNMKEIEENENLKQVNSWGEIYRFFYDMEKNK